MEPATYKRVIKHLNQYSDIKKLSRQFRMPEELLLVMYTQKKTRETTKKFYRVKHHIRKHHNQWKNGRSIVSIAEQLDFPPTLVAMMILDAEGISKRQFWKYMRGQEGAPTKRLRKEIAEVNEKDYLYSPRGMEVQYERGKVGEEKLCKWLDENGVTYKTEEELRGVYPKTPDALLDRPVRYNGKDIYWIESKAIFGDYKEVKRHLKNQLVPYYDLFGPGIVIYWFGFISDIKSTENIFLRDYNFVKGFKPVMNGPAKTPEEL